METRNPGIWQVAALGLRVPGVSLAAGGSVDGGAGRGGSVPREGPQDHPAAPSQCERGFASAAAQQGNLQHLCCGHRHLGSHCTLFRTKIKYFTFLGGLIAGMGCVGSPSLYSNGECCSCKGTSLKIMFPPVGVELPGYHPI